MRICIIRHGETDWNIKGKLQGRENIPLNKEGIKQIEGTIEYLKKYKWDKIITSPLLRARQSAEIIAKNIGINGIHEEENFIERDYGEVSGMTAKERKEAFPDGKYNGLEVFEDLQRRIVDSIIKYKKLYQGKNLIVVSHGKAINSLLSYLSNNEIGNGKTILKNACITLLEYNGNRLEIIFCNKEVKELL
jgi:uncharacterized phosphatase